MHWYQKKFIPPENPRVLLITGATSGIGRAAARLFAAMGDHVAATGRRVDRLDALRAEAEQNNLPGAILPLEADVTDPDAMQRAVALTLAEFNRLDVLIANAGIGHRGPLVDSEWADIEHTLRTNIDGVIHSVRAAIPAMRASGGGHIVLISSIVGPLPPPYASVYGASKAAVDALGRALRTELKPDRIKVSVLWVGQTHTEFAERRLGQPGKVASRWPTMTPEQVAGGIARALERNPRFMTIRWIDGVFVWLGRRFPALMDRLLARIYG
ncbi:MAG: SDR family NAD(P)-dependent oxidoreductase [Anaerolineae bacterium]|nr:SDR family NAD(P)-dependent oxidoreductase [Anaerolineae bacterium]